VDIAGSRGGVGFVAIHHLVDDEKINTPLEHIKLIDGSLM
jgi:hypothetical protein